MTNWIGPSIDLWGTIDGLEFGLDIFDKFLLNVSFHSNNFRTKSSLGLVVEVYIKTNNDLHYQRLWRDQEGQIRRLHLHPLICRFALLIFTN